MTTGRINQVTIVGREASLPTARPRVQRTWGVPDVIKASRTTWAVELQGARAEKEASRRTESVKLVPVPFSSSPYPLCQLLVLP